MKKSEARSLIGQRVNAWTSMNGVYVGTLVEIVEKPRSPWRGRVRIDGILEPAVTFDFTRRIPRRGFRIGEIIEVGHTSIKPTDATGSQDYLALLEMQAEDFECKHRRYLAGEFGNPDDPVAARNYGWYGEGARLIRSAVEKERSGGADKAAPNMN